MKYEFTDLLHHLRIRVRLNQQINYVPSTLSPTLME